MQYFEWNLPNDGKLWVHLKEDAKHLHDIGITSVWIPPAYKADEQQDEGYAVYDLYDLGEFDQKGTVRTKYGTRHELEEAVAALHENGIAVYLDTVMNQKTGADYTEKFMACEVDPENREQVIGAPVEVEGWTGYSFPGRGDKYSPFKWHWYHFSGTDQVYETGKRAIYLIQGEGKKWSEGVDGENGNYDFLIFNDVDFDHPEVTEEMKRWGVWIAQTLDADGMRLDALKHIKNAFIADFMHNVRASRGKEFYAVGEYWSGDFESLEAYLDAVDHQIDLFDAPLHFKLFTASQQGLDFDMRTLLDDTLVQKYPTLAVTFVDNHDSQRGSSLESQVKSWFKPLAYGLILLMKEGYPCVFYGDEKGLEGASENEYRRPMDFGRADGLEEAYRRMIALRKEHPALRHGDFQALLARERLFVCRRSAAEESLLLCWNAGGEALPVPGLPKDALPLLQKGWKGGLLEGRGYVVFQTAKP